MQKEDLLLCILPCSALIIRVHCFLFQGNWGDPILIFPLLKIMSNQKNWKNNAPGEQYDLCSLPIIIIITYSPIGEWTKHDNIDLAKGNMIISRRESGSGWQVRRQIIFKRLLLHDYYDLSIVELILALTDWISMACSTSNERAPALSVDMFSQSVKRDACTEKIARFLPLFGADRANVTL